MQAETRETDMRSFEGALDEDWCHVSPGGIRLCGCSSGLHATHRGNPDGQVCNGCGRRNCPDCRRIWREMRS